jgi:hypothetical protein
MNEYTLIENILNELKGVVQREDKRHEMDCHLTPSMLALLEGEIIPLLENELDYDPTPQHLYDNNGGEPVMLAGEIHHAAWVQHQALHS